MWILSCLKGKYTGCKLWVDYTRDNVAVLDVPFALYHLIT